MYLCKTSWAEEERAEVARPWHTCIMQLAYAAADPWQMFQHLSSVLHGQRNGWGLREKELDRAKP